MNFKINQARLPHSTVAYGYGEAIAVGVGIAAAAASTYMGVASAQNAASAREDAARYQAGVAENNAKLSKNNAAIAIAEGEIQVQESQQQTAQRMGAILAGTASSGVDTGFGTSVRLQADTAKLGQTDILTIRNRAENKAISFLNQEGGFNAQAGLYGSAGRNARIGGYLEAGGSLLSGAGRVADKWSSWYSSPSEPTFGQMNPEGFN